MICNLIHVVFKRNERFRANCKILFRWFDNDCEQKFVPAQKESSLELQTVGDRI